MPGTRSHARRRTWTLGDLDREGIYRLWFDEEHARWEISDLYGDGEPLVSVPGDQP